jgi:hypothetical protein
MHFALHAFARSKRDRRYFLRRFHQYVQTARVLLEADAALNATALNNSLL